MGLCLRLDGVMFSSFFKATLYPSPSWHAPLLLQQQVLNITVLLYYLLVVCGCSGVYLYVDEVGVH